MLQAEIYNAKGRIDRDGQLAKYAPLVKRIAHHMMGRLPSSVCVDDLMQAGMIGLLDALDRYDESHGAQFETYAAQRIRGAMIDELRAADAVPRGVRRNMRKIEAAVTALEQRLGRAPREPEIADALGLPLAEYQEMLQDARGYQVVSAEDFDDGDDEPFLDRHASDARPTPIETLADKRLRTALIKAIGELPEREKLVMSLYYDQQLNLREIGAVLGVTEARVCQIHSQAVARLRTKLRDH